MGWRFGGSVVPHVMLAWECALAAAAGLAVAAAAIRVARLGLVGLWAFLGRRPPGRAGAWALWGDVTLESALLFGLYALWQFAGSFTVMSAVGAVPRARWLWHAERVLYLPSETALQRPFLAHPVLVQAFNLYYDILHFPVLGACLVWLYARHRASYPRVRTTVALFTRVRLLIQLIPVAPPRLPPGTGIVDTAVRYGQSVDSWHRGLASARVSAMPA